MNSARFKACIAALICVSLLNILTSSIYTYFSMTFIPEYNSTFRKLLFLMTVVPEYNFTLNASDVPTILFYNIYTPQNENLTSHSLNIVNEQLEERETSNHPYLPLYYFTFGKDIGDIQCENCHHLQHSVEGDEVWTLSILHKFCLENPEKNVAYFHNKGSFHSSKANDDLRHMLTKSVFSEECLLMKNPKNNKTSPCNCNVCSARFSPLPHYHTSGNMWVTKCDYVSKLAPPNKFGEMMTESLRSAPPETFGNPAEKLSHAMVGRDRYASEHWVYSHPDVCPCDVYQGQFSWNYLNIPSNNNWTVELAQAPRFPRFEDYLPNDESGRYVKKRAMNGIKEGSWYHLSGRLHEWKSLYDAVPESDSWVWSYYEKDPIFGKVE